MTVAARSTAARPAVPAHPAPALELPLVGGGTFRLADLIRPDGTTYYASILPMPVGRQRLDDLIGGIDYWSINDDAARAAIDVPRPSPITLLSLAAASWAVATVTTKVTLEQLSPVDLLAIEVSVGAGAVWLALVLRGGAARAARRWRSARLGLVEPALTFALFDIGIDRTGAADAAVLVAAQSIFTVALSWLVLRERTTARVGAAVALGFAGVVVVVGSDGSGHGATVLGDVLVLASSAAAAVAAVLARRIGAAGESDAVTVTAWQLLAAAIACAPVLGVAALAGRSALGAADPAHLLAAIATGLLGSAVPFLLYNTAIRELNVSVAAVILNLIPVFGAGLAIVLLGNSLSPLQLVGAAAIVLAAFGIDRDDGRRGVGPGPLPAPAPAP